jgi:hypothetical protein
MNFFSFFYFKKLYLKHTLLVDSIVYCFLELFYKTTQDGHLVDGFVEKIKSEMLKGARRMVSNVLRDVNKNTFLS